MLGELVSLVVAADHLGISMRTLRRMLADDQLPTIRIRRRRLVRREALVAFIERHEMPARNAA